jgi:rhomboid protease GluP
MLERATPYAWVTPALVGLLIACWLGSGLLGVSLLDPDALQLQHAGANWGPGVAQGQWWRLVTATLLHAGIVHLLFNLYALWSVGRLTERIFGNTAYIAIYVASGIGASMASVAWRPDGVSVGASGAIFGVYGALLAFVTLHRGGFPRELLLRQRNALLGFVAYNVLFGLTIPFIDMAAHMGGLAMGVLAGALLLRDPATPAEGMGRRVGGAFGIAAILVMAAALVWWRLRGL